MDSDRRADAGSASGYPGTVPFERLEVRFEACGSGADLRRVRRDGKLENRNDAGDMKSFSQQASLSTDMKSDGTAIDLPGQQRGCISAASRADRLRLRRQRTGQNVNSTQRDR